MFYGDSSGFNIAEIRASTAIQELRNLEDNQEIGFSSLPMTQQSIEDVEGVVIPDINHLVTEDDTPVGNFQSAQQQRLLVEPLYSSGVLTPPFIADANVGLFYKLKGEPIVPDAMLSLGVQRPVDFSQKQNRSYFVWEFGKPPEVCLEIVSNQEGNELSLSRKAQQTGKTASKKEIYAQIGVPYYVVFDPLKQTQGQSEMNGALLRVWAISPLGYTELTPDLGISASGQFVWLAGVGLGLMLWEGQFEEEVTRLWVRWCDEAGQPIPTGAEGQAIERQRSQRLADRLRSLGIDPDAID